MAEIRGWQKCMDGRNVYFLIEFKRRLIMDARNAWMAEMYIS